MVAENEEFRDIRDALCEQTKLSVSVFRPEAPLDIYVDWSKMAIGAVLIQEDRPIYFYSRTLHGSELNYAPTEGECQAIRDVLTKFHDWIRTASATIYTDHRCLSFLRDNAERKTKFARILYLLGGVPGKAGVCERRGEHQ